MTSCGVSCNSSKQVEAAFSVIPQRGLSILRMAETTATTPPLVRLCGFLNVAEWRPFPLSSQF